MAEEGAIAQDEKSIVKNKKKDKTPEIQVAPEKKERERTNDLALVDDVPLTVEDLSVDNCAACLYSSDL